MPLFAYRAVNPSGQMTAGAIEAPKLAILLGQLAEKGLIAVSVREEEPAGAPRTWNPFGARVSRVHLANFTDHLGAMLSAGLPLIEALETLGQGGENPALARIAGQLAESVRDGRAFSEALAAHPNVFGELYVSMVRAGEESGQLANILERTAKFIETEGELGAKVRDALVYPAIVTAVAVLVAGAMLVFVIPKFVDLLTRIGAETPWPTRLLMFLSTLLVTRWPVLIASAIAAIFAARFAISRPAVRAWIDRTKLSAPIVGPLILRVSIARFSRTLGTLLGSGLPILQSLELVRRVFGNVYLEAMITRVADEIRDGSTITAPLRRTGIFPPMVTQMIHVGESSGSLERMLVRVGDIYEKEADRSAKKLAVVLEPVLIVGIGLFVSFVALALLLPMVKGIGAVGKG